MRILWALFILGLIFITGWAAFLWPHFYAFAGVALLAPLMILPQIYPTESSDRA